MEPIIDITHQLSTVHGGAGDGDLIAQGATMQNYVDCFKQAKDKLDNGQAAAMNTAQTSSPKAGMKDMLGAGKTFQKDMAACGVKFPIK